MNDIVDRIRKLLAVARDNGASENEQEQAMKFAQALMTKHGITHIEDKDTVGFGNKMNDLDKKHHHIIAHSMGRLMGGRAIITVEGGITFAGRESERLASEIMTNYVCDQVDMLYKQGLPKGLSQTERAQWRRNFKTSCAVKIGHRVEAMILEMTKNNDVAQAAVGCTALVVLNHKKQLEAEIDTFLHNKTHSSRSRSIRVGHDEASSRGYAAGEKVSLHQPLGKNNHKRLKAS